MSQFYSDPSRETDTYALPDCEVFYVKAGELTWGHFQEPCEAGWYFWFCFPGCMPDSDPSGPYKTEAEAIKAAREQVSD